METIWITDTRIFSSLPVQEPCATIPGVMGTDGLHGEDAMKMLVSLAVLIFSSIALALPITFDLRDPAIELIDEANPPPTHTKGGLNLTATLSETRRSR